MEEVRAAALLFCIYGEKDAGVCEKSCIILGFGGTVASATEQNFFRCHPEKRKKSKTGTNVFDGHSGKEGKNRWVSDKTANEILIKISNCAN